MSNVSANAAVVEFQSASGNLALTFDSAVMSEQEQTTFIEFGEDLGSMQDQVGLTVNLNINDVVKTLIEQDLMATGKVDDIARTPLLNLKAELIKAIEQINAVL